MQNKKEVAVIGAGFSGLSSACYLAKAGYKVTVYEKHDMAGGRARTYKHDGFLFDMGPSWYWMPDVFESFFEDFGKKVSDYYQLKRLSPGYRVFFKENQVDVPATREDLFRLFEKLEPGSSKNLELFLKEAEYKYRVGIKDLVYKPGIKLSELLDTRLIAGLFRLDVFKSMSKHVRKMFKSPEIIQILEFPILFLGALPQKTPALYSLMNYADLVLGTWYPMGGMQKIAEAMRNLAEELGVNFKTGVGIKKIQVKEKLAINLLAQEEINGFQALVSSADYHFTEQKLLEAPYRQYSESYWNNRKMAPSSLIFYLGVKGKVPGILHHNLFFDEDFEQHAKDIYSKAAWPQKPLFYLCCPSKTDPEVAPEGHENLFVLIPIAPGLKEEKGIREKYFLLVNERIKMRCGFDLKANLVHYRDYGPEDFSQIGRAHV